MHSLPRLAPGRRGAGAWSLCLLVLLSFSLVSCTTDDPVIDDPFVPPDPEDLTLSFSVYTIDAAKQATLIWSGDPSGPDAGSPSSAPRPQINATVSFRIEWEPKDPEAEFDGFQFKASEEEDVRLPFDEAGNLIWGDTQSFTYLNNVHESDLPGSCDTGPDCPDQAILGVDNCDEPEGCPGTHRFFAWAGSEDDETALVDARLEFTIFNERPTVSIVRDPSGTCGADNLYPHYEIPDGQGGTEICTFAEGDSIPAGAFVVFRMTGSDPVMKILAAKLPPEEHYKIVPEVRFQGKIEAMAQVDVTQGYNTFFAPSPSEGSDTIGFFVGPYHYRFIARTVDRLDVETLPGEYDTFDFIAGYPPRMISTSPSSSDQIVLKNPLLGGTWPQNTVPYLIEAAVTRWWYNGVLFDFDPNPGGGVPKFSGDVFRFALEFEGEGDPREPVSAAVEENYGAVRAFAYEWFSEGDPANTLQHGGGSDVLRLFDDSIELNRIEWSLTEAVEVFIPSAVWDNPQLFDPGTCPAGTGFCEMGDYLRRELGQITLRVQGRTTQSDAVHLYYPFTVAPEGDGVVKEIGELGLTTTVQTQSFPLQLGLDDGSGNFDRLWP